MADPTKQPIAALVEKWMKQADEQRALGGLEHLKLAAICDLRADELREAIWAQCHSWELRRDTIRPTQYASDLRGES